MNLFNRSRGGGVWGGWGGDPFNSVAVCKEDFSKGVKSLEIVRVVLYGEYIFFQFFPFVVILSNETF